jgi:hypothetical protein
MGSFGSMRRIPIITTVAALLLAAGCGGDDSSEPTVSVSSAAPTASTPTTDESAAPVPPDDSAGNPGAADDPGADRPRAVEDVVSAVMTASETPEVICDQLVTQAYVRTAYGGRTGCLAAQKPGALAESVDVTEVKADSGSATAVAVPTGGPYDGHDVMVKLIPAADLEDAWVVDSLVADVPAGP